MKQVAIGIDIGGTNTAIGVVDRDGNVLYEKKPQLPTPQKNQNPLADVARSEELLSEYIKSLTGEIRSAIDTVRQINPDLEVLGIGIGAPNGNYYSGTIEYAPNLPFVGVVNFAKRIEEKFPDIKYVKLTNDANAAALGEMIYGGGKGMKNFVMITLGTGLGSGLIVNGDLVYGADGFAGECGHTTIVPGGRVCGCGGAGHLEAYCSATGIKRTVYELLAKYNNSESELARVPFNDMTSKIVFDAAEKGDPIAREVFEATGELLGRGLADTVHHLSPEAIFLFGGAAAAGDYIFKPTRESMERHLLPVFRNKVKILPSELKAGTSAIVGASALVWKEMEKG
ncbi:MAG TPA: ROK family protein [Bacteroidales bacterium]|nr:ROK family protein [Bacteroidales bacterium]HPT02322.1 ROK family protein [Bacteroidales bacterium]